MVELGKVIFLGHIHVSIWALDTQEGAWAEKGRSYIIEKT